MTARARLAELELERRRIFRRFPDLARPVRSAGRGLRTTAGGPVADLAFRASPPGGRVH
jgi:hypothetical protein